MTNPRGFEVNTSKGFTLIELMIVVAIVVILASIAVPLYQSYAVRAKLSEPVATISTVKHALLDYYGTKGRMPDTGSPLMVSLRGNLQNLPTVMATNSSSNPGTPEEVTLGVTVTNLGGSTGNSASNNLIFKFVGSSSGITLDCSPGAGTTIEARYLPSVCRH